MFAYLFTERVVCLNKTELLAFQKKKTELLLYCWITAGADESYAASQPTIHPVRCAGAGGCCWSGVREKYCWLGRWLKAAAGVV